MISFPIQSSYPKLKQMRPGSSSNSEADEVSSSSSQQQTSSSPQQQQTSSYMEGNNSEISQQLIQQQILKLQQQQYFQQQQQQQQGNLTGGAQLPRDIFRMPELYMPTSSYPTNRLISGMQRQPMSFPNHPNFFPLPYQQGVPFGAMPSIPLSMMNSHDQDLKEVNKKISSKASTAKAMKTKAQEQVVVKQSKKRKMFDGEDASTLLQQTGKRINLNDLVTLVEKAVLHDMSRMDRFADKVTVLQCTARLLHEKYGFPNPAEIDYESDASNSSDIADPSSTLDRNTKKTLRERQRRRAMNKHLYTLRKMLNVEAKDKKAVLVAVIDFLNEKRKDQPINTSEGGNE